MENHTHRPSRLVRLAAAVLIACGLSLPACTAVRQGSAGTASSPTPAPAPPSVTSPAPSLPPTNPIDASDDPIVAVVKRVVPAVVNVTNRTVNPDALLGQKPGRAVGTGFIIRSDGVIVTNYHVVEGAFNLRVTLPDGRSFGARVIGGDSDHDLAVLKVEGQGLPTIPMGDSSKLALGERVIALGYALALPGGPTVTSGIISSRSRTVQAQDPNGGENGQGITRTYQDVLQTDAAINPGNSGGPLVDLAGNVVGINSAGAGQAENVGFSIAINAAKPIIERAVEHPSAPVAYMGVSTGTLDSALAAQFQIPIERGALVLDLAPGGPAEKAGIEVGDTIVAFAGNPVSTSDELQRHILSQKPGDTVRVEIVTRQGERTTRSITLAVRPLP